MGKIIKNNFKNSLVILVIFLMVAFWIFSGWPQIWKKPPVPPETKIAYATSTVGTENTDATRYENFHYAFRNPVGNQNYYTFYYGPGGGAREHADYAWSSTGISGWTVNVDSGVSDLIAGYEAGVDIFVDGTTLHAVHINPQFNTKTNYVHGSVTTGNDDFSWGLVQDAGTCAKGHNIAVVIDTGGRVWMVCATDSGDSWKVYVDADSAADPTAPPDAPSWTGAQPVDDTDQTVINYVAAVNIGINAIGIVWQDTTAILRTKKATWNTSITVSSEDTETALTMTNGMFSLVSDDSTNAHVLYKDGTNLIHQTIDFSSATPVFGAKNTVFSGEAVNTLSLSHNATDGEIVAFYVKSSDSQDIWYKTSDDTTIDWTGSETEIVDGSGESLAYLSAGRKDYNSDSKIQLTYTTQTNGNVRFHEQTVGIPNNPPTVPSVNLIPYPSITVNENGTTTATCTATIEDLDGGDQITAATATIYRSGVAATSSCSQDNNNCYQDITCDLSDPPVGNNKYATCTADIWFHADPTDSGDYSGETWQCYVIARDNQGATGNNTDGDPPELNTLNAVIIISSINYGKLGGGGTSTDSQTTIATTTGNAALDLLASSTDFILVGNGTTIPGDKQAYSLSNVAYESMTSCSTTSWERIETELDKPYSDPSTSTDTIYWKMGIPLGQTFGIYYATTSIVATADTP